MIKSLKGRLTLWYTLLFALISLGAFFLVYVVLTRDLNQRLDAELIDDAEEIILVFEKFGVQRASEEIQLEVKGDDHKTRFYRIFSPTLQLISATDLTDWQNLPQLPSYRPKEHSLLLKSHRVEGHEFEIRSIYYEMKGGYLLQIGFEPVENGKLFRLFQETFGAAVVLLIVIGSLLGFMISKYAMRGIDRLCASFERAGHGDFSEVVQHGREGEEIENLIQTFNRMQGRIHALISELRNVTNNIAHDLRSPITRIRGMSEMSLTGTQELSDYQETAGSIIEDCDILVGMINTMLEIAESDAGVTKISLTDVDISRMVHDVADIFLPVAEDKGIRLTVDSPNTPVTLSGDKARLQRALANLLDNALKYTSREGTVTLSVVSDESSNSIIVRDSGVGIPPEELELVFSRFYRSDVSRSTPGNGLGLALVRSIAHLHQGEVKVESTVNQGSTFELILPKA